MTPFSLLISDIEKITSDSVKISFNIPDNQKITFDFFAGQYITLESTIEGEIVRRAYSICSEPNNEPLSIAIKQIPNGKFSTFANTELRKGQTIFVYPPEGKFAYIHEIYTENLALFAAGSGITPLLSIIKVALHKTSQKIVLLYGNKTKESTMFLSEIETLKEKFPDRFFVHYIFSQSHEKNEFFGRIDETIINHLLKNKYKDIDFQRFYICGPQAMVQMIKTMLTQSYNPKNIHTELFVIQEVNHKKYEGTTRLSVQFHSSVKTFEIAREKSILESLLQHGLDVSYSCKGGACSSCISKVTEGKAEMEKNQVLSDTEIENGLILTCQAHPITDILTLNYDEV
ncbi:ferredoxin--NADP reductase [Capnocytophaga catalasegens]|uniref:Flavodoxin reductase n=1 Tax=Capnocytophaga catalasegens TaxID=1004260 RepID=A0AAV5AXS1_9FLAO|nr:ferredoxin--NADP reductase [Capnocytophaga catalasegens]GIZ15586.1 flavodoxin reductase [Capnocytophaga catalasegens]GJM50185.1 flavodoxin reductase [Capnocytophaga catalasegens]GJM52052.1 flavodoxin reductase [Capnocytophaga catalasegens]